MDTPHQGAVGVSVLEVTMETSSDNWLLHQPVFRLGSESATVKTIYDLKTLKRRAFYLY